jgi:hypothetical protein
MNKLRCHKKEERWTERESSGGRLKGGRSYEKNTNRFIFFMQTLLLPQLLFLKQRTKEQNRKKFDSEQKTSKGKKSFPNWG